MTRSWITLLTGLMLAGLVQAQGQIQRQVQGNECAVERRVATGSLDEQTYNQLTNIYEIIDQEQYAEAYSLLDTLRERTRRDDYTQAVILQAMGHVRMQQGDSASALTHFQQAIELNTLPNDQHYQMILMIANLYYGMDRFQDALNQLDLWFCVTSPEQTNLVDVWVMKASIHAQIDEFHQALEAVDRAISLSNEPKEQWYQLKLGMQIELSERQSAIETLKILIPMSPDTKNYWLQMAGLYLELGNERESKSALALAYRRGLLGRQTEFMQLASLLQAQDSPRLAAEVIEDGLARGIIEPTRRHWELAGGAWYQAREMDKALNAYEQAGRFATDGKIDIQRGFILIDLERWDEARQAITRALELGGLSESDRGNGFLLLGMAFMNLGNYDDAQEAFNQAANYSRVRQTAREWMNHLREERGRHSGR